VLNRCTELRDAHITSAVTSSEAMEALLTRFEEIAAPGKGAPILLAALARMGTTACDWIDGELRIEISGDENQTKIAASTTIGGGFREKVLRDTVLRVPFEEFSRGVARAPRLIEPLLVTESGKRLVLTVTQEVRKTSMPPPMVQIDPESLMLVPKIVMPHDMPRDVSAMEGNAHPPDDAPPPPEPKVVLRRRVRSPDEDPDKK
jgi:hypothetical protein